VDEEGCFGLVGFDKRHVEIGPGDLDGDAGQACTGPDVDDPPRIAEVFEEDQAIVDERAIGARHEARPHRNQSNELIELRILH
jgi:hypothetical protein